MAEYWRDAARALKRAIIGKRKLQLLGESYCLAYEARKFHEDKDFRFLKELARKRLCVFDVGANMGVVSLIMSSVLHESGRIYAFEASEDACRICARNFDYNRVQQRIEIINAVIAERSGEVKNFYWDHASGSASLVSGYLGQTTLAIPKATLALDDFVFGRKLHPDLLKIDVEGAEAAVLMGTKRTLEKIRPVVFVELHKGKGVSLVENLGVILTLLQDVDYKMIYLPTSEVVKDPSFFKGRGRRHVLVIPQEAAVPDWISEYDTSNL